MKCTVCNTELPDDAKLCTSCGAVLCEAEEQEPAATELAEEQVVVEEQVLEPYVPEPEKKPGNNGKNKIYRIGGGAIAAVIILIAVLSGSVGKKDPKTAVIEAFKSIYTQTGVKPMEEIAGLKELAANITRQSYEEKLDLKLIDGAAPAMQGYAGSGLSTDFKYSMPQKKGSVTLALQYSGMDFMSLDLYADDTNIMAAVPDLSSKVFTLDYANDLSGRLESSPYLGKLVKDAGIDVTALSDYTDYLKKIYDQEGKVIDLAGLWNRYKEGSKAVNQLKEAMAVTEKDKKSFPMDGKEVKCQGYDVLIHKEDMVDFLKTTSKFFLEDETFKSDYTDYLNQMINMSARLYNLTGDLQSAEDIYSQLQVSVDQIVAGIDAVMGDVAMTVYTDKKGRMASLDIVTTVRAAGGYETAGDDVAESTAYGDGDSENTADIEASTSKITLHASFKGGNYLTQNMNADITMSDENSTIGVTLNKNGAYDKKNLTGGIQLGFNDGFNTYGFRYSGKYSVDSGDYDVTFAALKADVEQFSLASQGNVSRLEKGKAYDVVMDQIDLKAAGVTQLTLSGSYSLKPLEGEITMPEGENMDILAASEKDWNAVGNEMMRNLFVYLMGVQQ